MHNFKIGDVVVRVSTVRGESYTWSHFVRDTKPTKLVITGVSGRWLQINNYTTGPFDNHPFHCMYFSPVEEVQEELPPAPESVRYFNSEREHSNDQHLVLEPYGDDSHLLLLSVYPRKGSTRATKSIGINLDADAALQLCHDLRRMAMELKRKEK